MEEKHSMPWRFRRLWSVLLGGFFLLFGTMVGPNWGTAQEHQSPTVVHVTMFTSSECEQCQYVEEHILPELRSRYGPSLAVKVVDVDQGEHYDLLERMERRADDSDNDLPVVFCGQRVLGGRVEVEQGLDAIIAEHLRTGGTAPIELDLSEAEAPFIPRVSISLAYLHPVSYTHLTLPTN